MRQPRISDEGGQEGVEAVLLQTVLFQTVLIEAGLGREGHIADGTQGVRRTTRV